MTDVPNRLRPFFDLEGVWNLLLPSLLPLFRDITLIPPEGAGPSALALDSSRFL